MRPINSLYTARGFFGFLERDVDAQGLILAVRCFPVTDRYLLNIAILTEELGLAQGFEKLILADSWRESCNVNKILLYNADSDQILAAFFLSLAFLCLALALLLGSLLLVLLNVGVELGNPMKDYVLGSSEIFRNDRGVIGRQHTLLELRPCI